MTATAHRSYTALECEREARMWLETARRAKRQGYARELIKKDVDRARYWWACAKEARRNCWCNGTGRMLAEYDAHTGYNVLVDCPDCAVPAALDGDDGSSVWQRCTPALLAAGIECATTKRRAGLNGVGHDHLVPIAEPALVDHDTPAGHLRNALQILTLAHELEAPTPLRSDVVLAVCERIHSALKGIEK